MEVEGSLVITQLDEDDDAKYQCLAKNVVGTRGSAKAQLSVLGKYSRKNHDIFLALFWQPQTFPDKVVIKLISVRETETEMPSSNYKSLEMNFHLFLCILRV